MIARTVARGVVVWFVPMAVLSLSPARLAIAQTSDGTPPSQEDVCDGLSGEAFGLCIAYCEALDCDSVDGDRTACQSLRRNFERVTGSPIFPCDEAVATPTSTSAGTETDTPTPTDTPAAATATDTPPQATATDTATGTPTGTAAATATDTPEPTVTDTPVAPTGTDTPESTVTDTPVPPTGTDTPEPTLTDTPTGTPTGTTAGTIG
jgi:hypothetical protein